MKFQYLTIIKNKKYISKLLTCENKIKESQELLNGIAKRKEEVINSFLTDESLKNEELKIAAEPEIDYKKQK